MTASKKIAVVSGAAAVAGAAVAAGRHRAAAAADEPPAVDPVSPEPVATSTDETKAELYERAKALRIRGRSQMNKAELQRAVAQRSAGATA